MQIEMQDNIMVQVDTQLVENADQFGEILRDFSFEERTGCYSCFDLIDGFKELDKSSLLGMKLLWVLGHRPDQGETPLFHKSTLYYNKKLRIAIGWHWDSDGHLVIAEGDKCAQNTDCKKDNGWHWVTEWKNIWSGYLEQRI